MSRTAEALAPDLFDARYPNSPGHKENTTSRDAAHKMTGTARALQARILALLKHHYLGLTADQCADLLGKPATPFGVRPRLTELQALGLVEDSGERRKNVSKRWAKVWRAK